MRKKLDFRRITAWLLCLLLCGVSLPQGASAVKLDEVGRCSLSLTFTIGDDKQPMGDLEFRLYRVAEFTDAVTFRRVDPFREYSVTASDWLSRAATLSGCVSRDNLPADVSGRTDGTGEVRFEDLEKGLYLILGGTRIVDGYIYTPTPFLLSLPYTSDGINWEADVTTYAKYTRRSVGGSGKDPGPVTVQYRVLKVWDDKGHEDVRPESVDVDLLRDGRVYDTVTLSAENNWRWDWAGLSANADWQVAERAVEGYSVSVSQGGITFVVTNTCKETPPKPSGGDPEIPPPVTGEKPFEEDEDLEEWEVPLGEKPDLEDDPKEKDPDEPEEELEDDTVPLSGLPQTGQLWWPVPVLAMGGAMLMFIGLIQRRRWNGEDEV